MQHKHFNNSQYPKYITIVCVYWKVARGRILVVCRFWRACLNWNRNRNTREHKLNVTTLLQLQIFCKLMHASVRACVHNTILTLTQAFKVGRLNTIKPCYDTKILCTAQNAMITFKLIDFCRPRTIVDIPSQNTLCESFEIVQFFFFHLYSYYY